MYARLASINLGPGMREAATELAKEGYSAFNAQKGFIRGTWFGKPDEGKFSGLTLWESKEDLEAAMAVLTPQFEKAMQKYPTLKGPATVEIYEVFEIGD